ncbi:hypothetical protein ACRAWD_09665 [Caulobacter segnis]
MESAVNCGRRFSTLSIEVAPWNLTSSLPTTVIGLAETRFGRLMREPVTTTRIQGRGLFGLRDVLSECGPARRP